MSPPYPGGHCVAQDIPVENRPKSNELAGTTMLDALNRLGSTELDRPRGDAVLLEHGRVEQVVDANSLSCSAMKNPAESIAGTAPTFSVVFPAGPQG